MNRYEIINGAISAFTFFMFLVIILYFVCTKIECSYVASFSYMIIWFGCASYSIPRMAVENGLVIPPKKTNWRPQ